MLHPLPSFNMSMQHWRIVSHSVLIVTNFTFCSRSCSVSSDLPCHSCPLSPLRRTPLLLRLDKVVSTADARPQLVRSFYSLQEPNKTQGLSVLSMLLRFPAGMASGWRLLFGKLGFFGPCRILKNVGTSIRHCRRQCSTCAEGMPLAFKHQCLQQVHKAHCPQTPMWCVFVTTLTQLAGSYTCC